MFYSKDHIPQCALCSPMLSCGDILCWSPILPYCHTLTHSIGRERGEARTQKSPPCRLHGCLWHIPKYPQGLQRGKTTQCSGIPDIFCTVGSSAKQPKRTAISFFIQPVLTFVVHTRREKCLQSFPRVLVPGACVTATLHCSVIREIKGAGPICQFLSILPAKLQPSSKKTRQLIFGIIH